MGIPIQKLLAELPKKRREKIKAKAAQYTLEYQSLAEFRKNLGITQETIAGKQGVKQVNISNLEKRNDMLISTLRKYVDALGCQLEISIRTFPSEIVTITDLNRKLKHTKASNKRTDKISAR